MPRFINTKLESESDPESEFDTELMEKLKSGSEPDYK